MIDGLIFLVSNKIRVTRLAFSVLKRASGFFTANMKLHMSLSESVWQHNKLKHFPTNVLQSKHALWKIKNKRERERDIPSTFQRLSFSPLGESKEILKHLSCQNIFKTIKAFNLKNLTGGMKTAQTDACRKWGKWRVWEQRCGAHWKVKFSPLYSNTETISNHRYWLFIFQAKYLHIFQKSNASHLIRCILLNPHNKCNTGIILMDNKRTD